MRNVRGTRHSLPNTRTLTAIAQDPSIKFRGKILTTELRIPAEDLLPGPCGYRVNVIDYDSTTNTLYEPMTYGEQDSRGKYVDPFAYKPNGRASTARKACHDRNLIENPKFHAQHVYAIAMRTLAQFEFALGRRCAWGSDGHQIHIAPHAFADANAFYSRLDRGIFFGYFAGADGKVVYTCLAHDVVAHETTHALLDGLRWRYMEHSMPEQAGFHEGFADIVALLSVFSLPDVVDAGLDLASGGRSHLISSSLLEADALKKSVLFGLAKQMGRELSEVRGDALRRSVELPPGKPYMSAERYPEFAEPHRRGELLVAAFINSFLDIWLARLSKIGPIANGKKDRSIVRDEGAQAAGHVLTMAIRAIDYCPPTDITFSDYLSALLTIDREVVSDDGEYHYRAALLKNFKAYDIQPAEDADIDGTWKRCDEDLIYSRSHYDSMLRDKEEVFRFIWENRKPLGINEDSYIEVQSVRPSLRVGPDGFLLHETVAEYIQILTLQANELKAALGIAPPSNVAPLHRLRIFGGGALIFNEYGQLKYQIANRIENAKRQQARLDWLAENGLFDAPPEPRPPSGPQSQFADLHRLRVERIPQ
jgi:hypothetical protein